MGTIVTRTDVENDVPGYEPMLSPREVVWAMASGLAENNKAVKVTKTGEQEYKVVCHHQFGGKSHWKISHWKA